MNNHLLTTIGILFTLVGGVVAGITYFVTKDEMVSYEVRQLDAAWGNQIRALEAERNISAGRCSEYDGRAAAGELSPNEKGFHKHWCATAERLQEEIRDIEADRRALR